MSFLLTPEAHSCSKFMHQAQEYWPQMLHSDSLAEAQGPTLSGNKLHSGGPHRMQLPLDTFGTFVGWVHVRLGTRFQSIPVFAS